MRILDENGNEILNPDFSLGYVTAETIFIAHHDAVPEVKEQFHYEILKVYKNGGKEVIRVIDIPGQKAVPAWDEYEDILRWHWNEPAPPEDFTVKHNVIKGEYFVLNGQLYLATENIPNGIRIVPNANCIKTSVEEVLTAQGANNEKTDI